jgi:predicted ATPase
MLHYLLLSLNSLINHIYVYMLLSSIACEMFVFNKHPIRVCCYFSRQICSWQMLIKRARRKISSWLVKRTKKKHERVTKMKKSFLLHEPYLSSWARYIVMRNEKKHNDEEKQQSSPKQNECETEETKKIMLVVFVISCYPLCCSIFLHRSLAV